MARDNKIRMPSGTGGITSYYGDSKSRIELPPGVAIVALVIVVLIMVLLHTVIGPRMFG